VAYRVRRKLMGGGVELVTVRGLGYLLREAAGAQVASTLER